MKSQLLNQKLETSNEKILIGGLPFIVDEIREWHKVGLILKEEMLDYNWEYRKKHCFKCSPIEKSIHKCFEVNKFVNGVQETHCKKMIKARTQKFRKKINAFLDSHP